MREHEDDAPAGMLPWSIEAESGVLSALLLNNEAWDRVCDVLTGAVKVRRCGDGV